MKIGAMNHPAQRAADEIAWMSAMGLDFIDLTLEPPAAGHWQIDVGQTLQALRKYRMGIVGHTAYYLPLGHPFEEIREGAVAVFRHCLEIFARLGAHVMNIHPDFRAPMHDRAFSVAQNLRSIRDLLPTASELGITLMVENLPQQVNNAAQLGVFLDEIPELGLHLDIGHTNLKEPVNTCGEILNHYGHRLQHVHLHDNRGEDDLHLPLGAGTLDLPSCLRYLKDAGYDGTITLEVFTPDREYLRYSTEVLRRLWESL